MSYRFSAPELLRLGPPPPLARKDFESLKAESLAELIARFNAAGLPFNVGNLEANPAVILTRTASYRDMMRRQAIDDAVAKSYLGSATDGYLDRRAADYGVRRRIVEFANPLAGTPEVLEDDESLRLRARLAWEALSVAGPLGAYVFHAVDAHPDVFDAMAYGPETGIVQPGEILVVVQSRGESGVPSTGIVDAVAARLDAYEVIYPDGSVQFRPVRNEQSVRPLGARVTVVGARPLVYPVTATLFVDAHGDRETIRLAALANLFAYQESRKRIGRRVPRSGLEAALALVTPGGVPVVADVDVLEADLIPSHLEIPVPGPVSVTVQVR